ncbi:MAG: hypothetical protein K2Q10_08010, partial [Rhodospirillales bacterium]|nr:hypothetical protein [Rhodospirillales bacterium]
MSPLLPVTAGPRPLGGEARANMVHRLMLDVERKAGIKVGPQVEQKLLRLLNDLPPEELAGWVASMESADPDNPDYLSMIESLTVHETYFYRDKPQLDHLRQNVFPKLVAGRRTMSRPTLTIWSAASSTGEEPYTFAMMALLALLEAGEASENANAITPNPRWGITVVGTDISRQALRTARDATYAVAGLSSFRDLPKELERFFIAPPRDMAAEAGGIARTV